MNGEELKTEEIEARVKLAVVARTFAQSMGPAVEELRKHESREAFQARFNETSAPLADLLIDCQAYVARFYPDLADEITESSRPDDSAGNP